MSEHRGARRPAARAAREAADADGSTTSVRRFCTGRSVEKSTGSDAFDRQQ
jgi:hypothetical protein